MCTEARRGHDVPAARHAAVDVRVLRVRRDAGIELLRRRGVRPDALVRVAALGGLRLDAHVADLSVEGGDPRALRPRSLGVVTVHDLVAVAGDRIARRLGDLVAGGDRHPLEIREARVGQRAVLGDAPRVAALVVAVVVAAVVLAVRVRLARRVVEDVDSRGQVAACTSSARRRPPRACWRRRTRCSSPWPPSWGRS